MGQKSCAAEMDFFGVLFQFNSRVLLRNVLFSHRYKGTLSSPIFEPRGTRNNIIGVDRPDMVQSESWIGIPAAAAVVKRSNLHKYAELWERGAPSLFCQFKLGRKRCHNVKLIRISRQGVELLGALRVNFLTPATLQFTISQGPAQGTEHWSCLEESTESHSSSRRNKLSREGLHRVVVVQDG